MATPHRVNKPYGLNHGLRYLPWPQLLGGLSPFDLQSIKESCLQDGDTPVNTVRLIPGMVLRLRQALVFQKGKNSFVSPVSTADWVVPSGVLSSDDFFFLSALLSTGEPDATPAQPVDYVEAFRRWVQSMAAQHGDNFLQEASRRIQELWKQSCEIVWEREGQPLQPPGTAACVREWLTQPSAGDAAGTNRARSFLKMRLPVVESAGSSPAPLTFRVFHSAAGVHLHPVDQGFVPNLQKKNAWFNAQAAVFPSRSTLEARVRFRFSTSPTPYDAPVYWSWGDVEEHYGMKVEGVRRHPSFIACARDQGFMDPEIEKFKGPDGRAHIVFDGLPGVGERFVQLVGDPETWRHQLLVAPGDIFVVKPGL